MSADNTTRQSLQKITTQIDGQLQQITSVKQIQERLLSGQDTSILQLTQQLEKTRVEQLKATRKSREEHAMTRREVVNGNAAIITNIQTISSKLDDVRNNALQVATRAAPVSNRAISFFGQDRETIQLPLLLIKDHVRRAVLHLLSHHTDKASARHLHWLQSEFDTLLRSVAQEAAAFCGGSTATSFDNWSYSSKSNGIPYHENSWLAKYGGGTYRSTQRKESSSKSPSRRFKSSLEVFSFSSSIGELHVMAPRSHEGREVNESVDEARILFIARKEISTNSIGARFLKCIDPNIEPRLYIQLHTFRVIDDTELYAEIFYDSTIEEIDNAFRTGVISPYDKEPYEGLASIWVSSLVEIGI
jgi:hypothetical protein